MGNRRNKTQRVMLGDRIPNRPCLHVESGRTVIPKICTRGYECWHCAFDQWIDEIEDRRSLK